MLPDSRLRVHRPYRFGVSCTTYASPLCVARCCCANRYLHRNLTAELHTRRIRSPAIFAIVFAVTSRLPGDVEGRRTRLAMVESASCHAPSAQPSFGTPVLHVLVLGGRGPVHFRVIGSRWKQCLSCRWWRTFDLLTPTNTHNRSYAEALRPQTQNPLVF